MSKEMSISVVKSTTKTNLDHNNRTMNKSEMRGNEHIDVSMSDTNIYLVSDDIEELYENEFAESLENYNNKQKRNDRKIENYYDHVSNSKKTSTQQEMIFQVGTEDDFKNAEDRKVAIEILEKFFKDFKKRNPQLKIYNAVIHNDEATPHLHINFVPIAENYKRGLEKQVSFDRAILQQDESLNKVRPFENWRENETLEIEKLLNERNITRKLVGTNNIADVDHFKKIKETERELKQLEEKVEQEQAKLATLKAREEQLIKRSDKASENSDIFVKKVLNDVKPSILNKDMVQIPKKDLETLKTSFLNVAKTNILARKEQNKMKTEYSAMKKDFTEFGEMLSVNQDRITDLLQENKELKESTADLNLLNQVYSAFKEYIAVNHDVIQKAISRFPIASRHRETLKGFVSASLTNRDFKGAVEVGMFAYTKSQKLALEYYKIGNTVAEHKQLNEKPKEIKKDVQEVVGISRLKELQKDIDKNQKKEQGQSNSKTKSRGIGR